MLWRFVNYEEYLKKLGKMPWRGISSVLAGGFIMASVASFFATYTMMPSFNERPLSSKPSRESLSKIKSSRSLDDGEIKKILERNIFNREGTLGDADPTLDEGGEEGSVPTSALVKSDLPVEILGIIYGGTPYNGLATIQNTQKNKINSFIVGDTLMKEAVVEEIHRERVIISRNGRREYIDLERKELLRSSRKKKAAPKPSSSGEFAPIVKGPALKTYKEDGFELDNNKIVMSDSFKQKILGPDFTKVLQDAKATPNVVDGQIQGFVLTRIREDSVYQKAGLQNDDIVMEINGVPLTNAASAIRLLQGLRSENEIEIIVNRGGSSFPMTLSIR